MFDSLKDDPLSFTSEGHFSGEHDIKNDPERPNITLFIFGILLFQNLWSNEIWSTISTFGQLLVKLCSIKFLAGESKINNFDFLIFIIGDQNVLGFQIAMNNFVLVKVIDPYQNLLQVMGSQGF
jgi:hypothetical protein